ncbi:MAG: hypothetical protein UX99_C0011G0011 [Candidatus Amesbacteria bacterium GW2011_GWB1_47_26]|uniref:Uncharacterized protein n=1 Tax=Candidatus Amesbacteria bacterium GW2011_GWC2_45_19 TaxID=1618366 RepID=A0A0G1M141_9BACT|nr:MAG: hypothetical protein UX05_C0016G0010 [Candidatus Amesbacteria bacterium GW2011_GWC2_45_19]KKU37976.1 MAG: hypothetical protein UX52_C0013G0010 [Candidatus Amesbacteria bacterium GW2011_GWA1_46_35]KKU68593.1 MAG: hypothetical protein UX93_C0006G0010 [Microgenomates group bacterium GW2011_GWC1_47_20]KKU74555.1 MAG: hypothetical protein UX99_C0011G0011 [Candidatus Amesbacteria bacterium GW2011_GWB1_47_26]
MHFQAGKNAQWYRERVLSDYNEGIREESSQRSLQYAEEEERALSASPGEVLARAKTFYDRTVALASSGVDGEQLALQLGDEFPNLMNFYGLLRRTIWGDNLTESVSAAATRKALRLRGK